MGDGSSDAKPRVFLSMTTIPSRNGTLTETLQSIAAQTVKADGLHIFGAPGAELGLETYGEIFPQLPPVSFYSLTRDRDHGPVTKLSILENPYVHDDDIVVTIDDDIVYQPKWLEELLEGARVYPNAAVGMSGWNVWDFLRANREMDTRGGAYVWPTVPGACDVLEDFAGIAYRKRFFYIDPVMGFASVLHPLKMFHHVDDVWIAYHLHRRGVPRMLVHNRMAQERPQALPGLHHREDFVELNRQAAIFAFGGQP